MVYDDGAASKAPYILEGPAGRQMPVGGPLGVRGGRPLPMREAPGRALVCHGHGPELVVHSLKALPSLACEARTNQSNRQLL